MLLNILFMSMVYAQENNHKFDLVLTNFEAGKLESAKFELNKIDTLKLLKEDFAKYYYLKAKISEAENLENIALKHYLKAKKIYLSSNNKEKAVDLNLDIAYLLKSHQTSNINAENYLKEYLEFAKGQNNPLKLAEAYTELASLKITPTEYEESFTYFQIAKKINRNLKNKELESQINNNLAALYLNFYNLPDSAIYYFEKDLKYLETKNNKYFICSNYINQAAVYYQKKNYKTAINKLKTADTIKGSNYEKKIKSLIALDLSANYEALGKFKEAYESYLIHQSYQDSINEEEQEIAINDIQTKYQTREKELENEVLTGKVKKKNILVYIVVGLLIASLIIGFLIVKNARRREHISKQEKLIEQQKLEKALKEYELSSIDLMLEGQEKERQRIANDLHDNLGSMLATLKMNFEHLRLRKNELREEETKLYDRTDELIEEAYQKVRRLAHAKNAGVFANEGLIPTIRKMAEKISIPGKLSIEVMAVGFNKRLENTIEIAIFRMVQELSTNIIKHSQATEASIQLTNHDENINIIIEDNGVGFSTAKTHTSDGMGLNTIRKKVEQLGGTFTIDSTPGKGTTIIIDLPI